MKVLLITNILSPYRKNFYDEFFNQISSKGSTLEVWVMASSEPNRNWDYEDYKSNFTRLLRHITLRIFGQTIHLNFGLNRMIKLFNPDLVIASGSYTFPAVWQSIRLKKKLRFKLLFWSESHLDESRNYKQSLIKFREWFRGKLYKKFDGFLNAGLLSEKFIYKYSSKSAKSIFIPNLIREEFFYTANELRLKKQELKLKWDIPRDKFIFLCPARLTASKGILIFLDLLKEIDFKSSFTIVFAGEGELKDKIEHVSTSNKIDIKLVGYQEEKMMIELYSMADAFLLPSISDPNPLSTIEALWSGLPLFISEHVGNYPEAVRQNQNGFVFSYIDSISTIDKFRDLIFSTESWKNNAKIVSIEIAQRIYSTQKSVENLINNLNEILDITKNDENFKNE